MRLEGRVVADFESSTGLGLWSGLPVQATGRHFSSGQQAMTFHIPRIDEQKGEDPRPGVRLSFQDGKGFPNRDWSTYGALGLDVWVDGASQGRVGLKLLDSRGISSWTTHIEVTPGRKHEAWLSLEDVAGDIDPKDVDAVVIYSLRPEQAFDVTVDHLRLIPKPLPPPVEMVRTYPNYRDLLFPDAGPLEVAVHGNACEYGYQAREWDLVLRLEQGDLSEQAIHSVKEGWNRYRLSAGKMAAGHLRFSATVLRRSNRALLARRSWSVKKLTRAEAAGLKVYVDRNNNTIVDGKPFFPLGFYANTSLDQMREVKDSPFNTLLMYGTNRQPRRAMESILHEMESAGLKLIYCLNDVYPWADYLKDSGWEGVQGNEAITSSVVHAYREHPALLAWYLNDELPRERQPELLDYFRRVRDTDPAHPTLITLCQNKDFPFLWGTTDILSPDPYPIPKDPITRVADMMIKAKAPSQGSQPVWLVPQAFAWYQHSPRNNDRARIPDARDLADGRAPTYEEGRCMTYLGLVHGAKGLIYWCYYNMRVLPQYQEMWAWMKSIGEEVKRLAPVLMSSEDQGALTSFTADSGVHTLLKRHGGHYYLLAVNTLRTATRPSFRLPMKCRGSAVVWFENRQVEIIDQGITDAFQPLAVHVYQITPGSQER